MKKTRKEYSKSPQSLLIRFFLKILFMWILQKFKGRLLIDRVLKDAKA
jgi:hypothetical protein